ncbi:MULTISPECIES: rhomboid family intramembrane serine protease [unclassified Streptomyces]|uniref:rhomboid family intramembrane serine protease n=1 Tax=unclassified Streptomyces TaxID=2593676 RepID=UPI001BE617F7|nr:MULTISPECIES: rhomboid family intramembrane serine protease [unclassified Streptomyces]MBT2406817.1 rhomboid family intramembrane serine protease [Streptomyces sp. ISL-21]MBT2456673.1 rhomboid family intramembrane serine protease [Streptomyces sp. ISL-86]MBT2612175.1 rhomboid family intramembrane serine protease [Streptomyces sp. ISL-87]
MTYAGSDARSAEWSQADRAKAAGKLMLGWVALLWLIEVMDLVTGHALDAYGIKAREADGLTGIPLAPFLHFGFDHVASNSIPLLVLGFVAALSGIRRFLTVCVAIVLVDGLAVWLTSPSHSITMGASGLVFGLFGYLLVRGFVERKPLGVAVGIVIAAVWGTTFLAGALPTDSMISWQAHLFGLLAGAGAAFLVGRRPALRG